MGVLNGLTITQQPKHGEQAISKRNIAPNSHGLETPMTEITDEQIEQYEAELDEISLKQLVFECMVELKTIRWQNEQALKPQSESESEYECSKCGKTIPEGDLETHAETHGWHSGMDLDLLFDL